MVTQQTVLVDSIGRAQITDIGLATSTQNWVSVHDGPAYHEHRVQWAAPEILHIPGACSKEGDIFSFAGVMIEVRSRYVPGVAIYGTVLCLFDLRLSLAPPHLATSHLTWLCPQSLTASVPHGRLTQC